MPDGLTRYATGDWRFVLEDLRDAGGNPLDLTGYRLKIQFKHASLRNLVIDSLDEDNGITVSAGADGQGPTVTLVSLACNRSFDPLTDTPVIGDLMLYAGATPTRVSEPLQRIAFTARWGATRDA